MNQETGRSAADILTEFKETNNGEPPASQYWAHGYDATILLLSAIKQVAVSDGDTLHIDRAALRDALDGTEGFQGILGTLTCDDFGDCGTSRSVIRLHTDSSVTDSSLLAHCVLGVAGLAPASRISVFPRNAPEIGAGTKQFHASSLSETPRNLLDIYLRKVLSTIP